MFVWSVKYNMFVISDSAAFYRAFRDFCDGMVDLTNAINVVAPGAIGQMGEIKLGWPICHSTFATIGHFLSNCQS